MGVQSPSTLPSVVKEGLQPRVNGVNDALGCYGEPLWTYDIHLFTSPLSVAS